MKLACWESTTEEFQGGLLHRVEVENDGTVFIVIEDKAHLKRFSVEQIFTLFLAKLRESTEWFTGKVAVKTILTVPSIYSDLQRLLLKNAATNAGLEVI